MLRAGAAKKASMAVRGAAGARLSFRRAASRQRAVTVGRATGASSKSPRLSLTATGNHAPAPARASAGSQRGLATVDGSHTLFNKDYGGPASLVLSDGTRLEGRSFGADVPMVGEVVRDVARAAPALRGAPRPPPAARAPFPCECVVWEAPLRCAGQAARAHRLRAHCG